MKIAIITGASTGIGRAAAERMSAKGFHVLAGVRRLDDAPEGCEGVALDVTKESTIEAAVKQHRKKLEGASEVHLVNNAGIALAGPVEGVPLARWRELFDVNVFGLLAVTQAFLPFVRATKGRVVNISSVSGLAAAPYLGPYSSSKFAVEALSDALRRELKQFGCRVIVVEPGPVATPIWKKGFENKEALEEQLPPAIRKAYGADLKKFTRIVEERAANAVPVSQVSDAIESALTSVRPRTRYVVGTRALHTQMAAAQFLPDQWLDALIAREYR